MPGKLFGLSVLLLLFGSAFRTAPLQAQQSFKWPAGKRAAISLSFDDARLSQIDYGVALLEKYGIKATFSPHRPPSRNACRAGRRWFLSVTKSATTP